MAEMLGTHRAIFAVLFGVGVIGFGVLIVWVVENSPVAAFFQRRVGIVAPYFGALSVLFSLVMAFTIQDTWGRHTRADTAVVREAEAIRVIRSIDHALGDGGTDMDRLVADYASVSTGDDWRSPQRYDAAEAILRQMIQEDLFGHVAQASQHVQDAILGAISDIRTSLRDRIAAGDVDDATMKWVGALFLGCLTQMSLALVHLGKPRASRLAMVLFSLAMAFVTWATLVRLDVFAGRDAIPIASIVAASQSTN